MSRSGKLSRQRRPLAPPAPKAELPKWIVGVLAVVLATGATLVLHQADPAILDLPQGAASLLMIAFTVALGACVVWVAMLLGYSPTNSSGDSGFFGSDGDGGDGGGD